MAKDRFSRFKKSNYNSEFRWGDRSMNYNVIQDRQELNKTQRDWIVSLIQKTSRESNKKFLRSILERGKVPTEKQKKAIQSILKDA
jgi:hypothetical protein